MEHVWWGICLVNGACLVGDMFGKWSMFDGDMFGKWSMFGGGYVW